VATIKGLVVGILGKLESGFCELEWSRYPVSRLNDAGVDAAQKKRRHATARRNVQWRR
jgi:hypothetical protein